MLQIYKIKVNYGHFLLKNIVFAPFPRIFQLNESFEIKILHCVIAIFVFWGVIRDPKTETFQRNVKSDEIYY